MSKGKGIGRGAGKGAKQGGGKANRNWPSKTGNPSGKGRDNNPPKAQKK